MPKLTIEDVTAAPWEYTADQWQIAHGVPRPYIAEISPMQYAHLSTRGKRQYDAKREAEWSASDSCRAAWKLAVMGAYDRGLFTIDQAQSEARSLVILTLRDRKREEEERERLARAEANRYASVEEIDPGSRVYHVVFRRYGTVIRRNRKTVTVDFGDGDPRMTIPPQMLYRTDPRTV